MSKSEIIKELQNNYLRMQQLIKKQEFAVHDAEHYLNRYYNVLRKVEQLEISRNKWKKKCLEIKNELQSKTVQGNN